MKQNYHILFVFILLLLVSDTWAQTKEQKQQQERERLVFVGDSPNDQPMFAYFPNAIGVANVREMADLMETLPRYVAPSRGSAGFAEVADALLAAR